MDNLEWLRSLTESAHSAPSVILQAQSSASELESLRKLVDELIERHDDPKSEYLIPMDWFDRAKELRKERK